MKYLVSILCFIFADAVFAETWNCGPATNGVYSDSVQCTYDEASKTLTISGEGNMGDYAYTSGNGSSAPWYGKDIVHAVFEGNVTSIGERVFKNAGNLQDIKGTENITSVGVVAFYHANSLISIDLPNVQNIGKWAFSGNSSLEFAGIPEGVAFGTEVFKGSKISNCQNTGDCGNCGDKVIQSGVGCVNNCPAGHTSYYGLCTRYTLPEADSATSDDNENTIEWIFE